MAKRKFVVALEMAVEAETPRDAAIEFARRVRFEGDAFQVDVLEDRGGDAWHRLGRQVVQLSEVSEARD